MKAIIVASTGAALLALLSGCAGSPVALGRETPAQLSHESN